MLAQRLRDLDNRGLRIDQQKAVLRTEAGWRNNAARWWVLAVLAAAELVIAMLAGFLGVESLVGLLGMGGVLAFQAGMLKAEDDRLHRRGRYRYLPPGL